MHTQGPDKAHRSTTISFDWIRDHSVSQYQVQNLAVVTIKLGRGQSKFFHEIVKKLKVRKGMCLWNHCHANALSDVHLS